METSKKKLVVFALGICLLVAFMMMSASARAESLTLSDVALDGIAAKGDISIGSYSYTDSHQYDASQYKGAIQMAGNVQENVVAEVNLNQTQSAAAIGLNMVGNVTNSAGQTITQTNSNSATSFIGGF